MCGGAQCFCSAYDKRPGSASLKPLTPEELTAEGRNNGYCPSTEMKKRLPDADLILMPYNYLVDQSVRKPLKFSFANSILVLDEAHNLPEMLCQVLSFEITSSIVKGVK